MWILLCSFLLAAKTVAQIHSGVKKASHLDISASMNVQSACEDSHSLCTLFADICNSKPQVEINSQLSNSSASAISAREPPCGGDRIGKRHDALENLLRVSEGQKDLSLDELGRQGEDRTSCTGCKKLKLTTKQFITAVCPRTCHACGRHDEAWKESVVKELEAAVLNFHLFDLQV